MAKRKRSINSLVHDRLFGRLSKDTQEEFRLWLESSPENKKNYEQLVQESGLTDRFQQFAKIDEERAWERFQKKNFPVRRLTWMRAGRYAAILMLPLLGFAIWLWALSVSETQPVVSHESRVAMIRSERMGKQKATLTLTNGNKVDFQSAPVKSIQDSTVQYVSKPVPDVPTRTEAKVSNNKLTTYNDSEFWMTFEDGTRVHLNYNTTLRYPPHFEEDNRIVYLDGEAYFQVAKDSKRPFLVVTDDGMVKQYGTSFNVNTNGGEGTKVVLVEGSISVLPNMGGEYKIKPGEMAVLQSAKQEVQIDKVDLEPYIAWNTGRFVFDNCSLENLMNVVSHWYNRNIIFETEDIKQIPFTGDIDRYGSIIPLLKSIQHVTHLDIEIQGKNIIIRK